MNFSITVQLSNGTRKSGLIKKGLKSEIRRNTKKFKYFKLTLTLTLTLFQCRGNFAAFVFLNDWTSFLTTMMRKARTLVRDMTHQLLLTAFKKWFTGFKATCVVPPAEPLGNTSLTCHFPEDVSKTKKNFIVDVVPENGRTGGFRIP